MSHEIRPLELLFLWRLAVAGGGDWLKDIKPDPDAAARKRLQAGGVIDQEKRRSPSGRGKALYVTLTDQGWGWLGNHLDADLSTRTPAGTHVLHRLLVKLKAFLDQKQLSLGDLIVPSSDEAADDARDLESRVRTAYFSVSGGKSNVRVRIADLRHLLASIPRPKLDQVLLHIAASGKASLYRLDNPDEIQAEDRDAVLHTPTGEERHVVYFGGTGS